MSPPWPVPTARGRSVSIGLLLMSLAAAWAQLPDGLTVPMHSAASGGALPTGGGNHLQEAAPAGATLRHRERGRRDAGVIHPQRARPFEVRPVVAVAGVRG